MKENVKNVSEKQEGNMRLSGFRKNDEFADSLHNRQL